MSTGWFAFTVVAGLVVTSGLVLALALLKASWAQREREALSSTDLRALEESALLLIDQLREEVDAGIAEINARSEELRTLIGEADSRIAELRGLAPAEEPPVPAGTVTFPRYGRGDRILEMAEKGMASADIARAEGIDCAEVKLMLSLAKSRAA